MKTLLGRRKFLRVTSMALAICPMLCGCNKSRSETARERQQKLVEKQQAEAEKFVKQHPGAKMTLNGFHFLSQLEKSGQLPRGESPHGQKYSSLEHLSKSPEDDSTNYPLSRTYFQKELYIKYVNHYLIIKESEDSNWRIERAWQTDASNNIVQEFQVNQ